MSPSVADLAVKMNPLLIPSDGGHRRRRQSDPPRENPSRKADVDAMKIASVDNDYLAGY